MNRMRTQYTLVFLLLICLVTMPAPSGARSKPYRIGPTDVLTLTIHAGGEKQEEVDLPVSAQGIIDVPFIGTMSAKGLTLNELEKQIAEPLAKDYFVDPKVNVRVKEYHSLHYYVSGAVRGPGLYEMATEASLLELIAKAGGVLPGSGNLAYIMRIPPGATNGGNGEPIKVDLQRLLEEGDLTANVLLKPGDVVHIPLEKSLGSDESKKVYLEGEVQKPGVYDYRPGMTAMNACIIAGGFAQFAAPNRTRIIRQKGDEVEIIKINLNDVREGKIPDVELRPGDRLHVPETWL